MSVYTFTVIHDPIMSHASINMCVAQCKMAIAGYLPSLSSNQPSQAWNPYVRFDWIVKLQQSFFTSVSQPG